MNELDLRETVAFLRDVTRWPVHMVLRHLVEHPSGMFTVTDELTGRFADVTIALSGVAEP